MTNETIADIIAEMRFHGQQNIDAEKDKPEYGILTVEGEIALNYADRLDAAHKREPGDAAKLREALIDVVKRLEAHVCCDYHTLHPTATTCDGITSVGKCGKVATCATIFKARAALAAPPRNCDVGTAEEQYSRMFRECYEWECMDCKQSKDLRKCALSWAQKSYSEVKNKKSEWTFAHESDLDSRFKLPNLDDLYKKSLNMRDNKREMYNRALNAALENLMSWERAARADGFDVVSATDMFQGIPHPVYELRFVQSYGVQVVEGGNK